MSDKIRIYNNRLGNTTLAAPRELPVAMRAALQTQLTQGPGGHWDLTVETWEAMAALPGNIALVLTGEISTRKEDVERRRPPTSLDRLDRATLGAPRGPSDFVHGLRADPALLASVEHARKGAARVSSRAGLAQAALSATRPGDYSGLLEQLAAHGVDLGSLQAHLARAIKPDVAPLAPAVDGATRGAGLGDRGADVDSAKPAAGEPARGESQDRRTGKK